MQRRLTRGLTWIACLCGVHAACLVGTASAADLVAVYQRALQNDPQLREAEANRLAALESKPQALSAMLPQLNASALVTREHDTGSSNTVESVTVPGGPNFLESFPFDGHTDTNNHKYGVDLKQNLFRWENWVALQRADSQVAQAEADYQAAQQDLMSRVAQRYFDVLAARGRSRCPAKALWPPSIDNSNRPRKRYEVGLDRHHRRSRSTRVARQQRGGRHRGETVSVASAHRSFCAKSPGILFDTLARPIEPFELANPDPVSEDRWVDMALQQNLSLGLQSIGRRHCPRKREFRTRRPLSLRSTWLPSGYKVTDRRQQHQQRWHALTAARPSIKTQRTIGLQLTFPAVFGRHGVIAGAAGGVPASGSQRTRWSAWLGKPSTTPATHISGCLSEISRVKALRRAVESNATALECHGVRLRSRYSYRSRRAGVPATVDSSPDRLLAQPL